MSRKTLNHNHPPTAGRLSPCSTEVYNIKMSKENDISFIYAGNVQPPVYSGEVDVSEDLRPVIIVPAEELPEGTILENDQLIIVPKP